MTPTMQISTRISPWVFTFIRFVERVPWALHWIGEDRLARWIVRFGIRVEIK